MRFVLIMENWNSGTMERWVSKGYNLFYALSVAAIPSLSHRLCRPEAKTHFSKISPFQLRRNI